ncbi:small-conductance mechanosensitive channel [Polaribacter sp. Z014]|uniref:mechanosensitive ion channel family protein n=1 Tax=unclassified Polaribacter TaxID=196858 RepID=UPI00193B3C8D|nr:MULTISPECIES: small-conductance mechanosensitive channel [unclassified Polaribacter]MCL7764426.1 small-conductance mechanosensitive channel [Polaribacter sp. Z014]QVY67443.1 small-conductance mechanosensitive channel [Polaribacter sp. Q13]
MTNKLLLALKSDVDFSFLETLWTNFTDFLPQLLKGIGFLIIGWLLIKFLLYIIKKALGYTKIDNLPEKLHVDEIFGESSLKIQPTKIIITAIKWVLILIFIIVGSELLGLRMVSEQLSNLIGYLPRLISALVIFAVGIYVANLVKKALTAMFKSLELTGGNLVGNIAFYLIAIVVTVTALNQAGVNTDLITSNLSIILGAILASFTIAFGLGSRDVIKRLLFGYYTRKNIKEGDKVIINGLEGTVGLIDNICVVLITEKGKVIIPIKDIVDNQIEVID